MPAVSELQRRFMGAELSRARAGKKTRTGMGEEKLAHYASKVKVKSYMPAGATQSPKGDLGERRYRELMVQNGFKGGCNYLHSGSELGGTIGEIGSIGESKPVSNKKGPLGQREAYQRTGKAAGN